MSEVSSLPVIRLRPSLNARQVNKRQVELLAASIETVGLLNPITVRASKHDEGSFSIVAGHHRFEALRSLKRESIDCVVLATDDRRAMIAEIDENIVRLALTPAQEMAEILRRKRIYEELYPQTKAGAAQAAGMNSSLGRGDNVSAGSAPTFSKSTAAAIGKSRRSVEVAAARAEALGSDLLRVANTSLDTGVEIDALIKAPPEQRADLVARAEAGEEVSARTIRAPSKREVEKALAKEALERRIANGCLTSDLEELVAKGFEFPTILCDVPSRWKAYSDKPDDRGAAQHYPVDDHDSFSKLPVAKLAAKNAHLFYWTSGPFLLQALEVIEAWDFTYSTIAFTWMKQNKSGRGLFMGGGYWTRSNAEICLLATRGKPPPRQHADVMSAILSPLREHSRKPDEIHGRIERLLVGPYLELFGRRRRDNWLVFGNEIPRDDFNRDVGSISLEEALV